MSAAAWGLLALIAFAVLVVSAAIVVTIGLIVTRRHPGQYDPARAAKRYTVPVFVFFLLTVGSAVTLLVSLIGAAVALILP